MFSTWLKWHLMFNISFPHHWFQKVKPRILFQPMAKFQPKRVVWFNACVCVVCVCVCVCVCFMKSGKMYNNKICFFDNDIHLFDRANNSHKSKFQGQLIHEGLSQTTKNLRFFFFCSSIVIYFSYMFQIVVANLKSLSTKLTSLYEIIKKMILAWFWHITRP